jgi:O-antigen/teichoic acid export membrane protein
MKSVLLAVLAVLACAAASAHLPAVQSRGRANAPRAAARATEQPKVPTYRELQKFAVPALTLWISGPLLTLIDTSAVGLSASSAASGVFEIAALGATLRVALLSRRPRAKSPTTRYGCRPGDVPL